MKLPDAPALRQQLAWFATIRGTTVVRVYVYKNSKGETCAEVKPWDIYNVAYEKNDDGLDWAAYTYYISPKEAEARYGYKATGSGTDVRVIDYWDTEKYGIIVGQGWAENQPVKHNGGHCPVYVIRAGACPPTWQTNYTYTESHVGESVMAPIRDIMPLLNKTLSDYLTVVRRGVKVPLGIWSAD